MLLLHIAFSMPVAFADKIIRISVPSDGLPPLLFVEPGQDTYGLIIDVLQEIVKNSGYIVQAVATPEKRIESVVHNQTADVAYRAIEWAVQPERFVFTDSFFRVRDVVFSNTLAPVVYENPMSLEGKVVGTHLGYFYKSLDTFFQHGYMKREDAPTEKTILAKLLIGRSDVAILNEITGSWIIKTQGWADHLGHSNKEVDSYDLRFMFSKKWKKYMPRFNQELTRIKRNGRLAKLIAHYIKK